MLSTLPRGVRWAWCVLTLLVLSLLLAPPAFAEDDAGTKEAPTEKAAPEDPPPLPLHQFAGNGGLFVTTQAYLVNPAPEGEVFGLPSIGYIHVNMDYGRHLEALTATWTLWGRVEFGFGWNFFDTGDLGKDVLKATEGAVELSRDSVNLYNFNVRGLLLADPGPKEWWPGVVLGVHYKHNDTIDDLDEDLGGGLHAIGIEDNSGVDFTLVTSKYFAADWMPVPVSATAGVRMTKAAHVGLLGFTDDYTFQGEFSLCSPITPKIWVAAEYRFKPNEYDAVPGLIEREQDWWTIDVCYLPTSQLSIAVGYGHFGWVLNHRANRSLGIAVKFEF